MKKTITMLILFCVAAFAQQKGSFTDSRDKKTYKTVKIGEQTWMAENLNYNASGSTCYGNKPANCDKYGRLYEWKTAKKICPAGWHLPTKEEWDILIATVGGKETAGKFLKATSGWNKNGNGTDKFGFAAMPGGEYFSYTRFAEALAQMAQPDFEGYSNVGNSGEWWSVTESIKIDAHNQIWCLDDCDWNFDRDDDYIHFYSFSIRCLKGYETAAEDNALDNALNLTVAISDTYIEVWARGGSLPKIFYKECQDGKTTKQCVLHKKSEKDPGTVQMSVYSKTDSAYLNNENEFITNLSDVKPGAIVATLSESSSRMLACGRQAPGVEDICINGKPAISLRPRSVYDELAKTLIMIHNRFIDTPDADNIIVLAEDDTAFDKIINVMDRAKAAGFYEISISGLGSPDDNTVISKLVKIRDRAKKMGYNIVGIKMATKKSNNFSAYNLMKDKNFAKDIERVLENVAGLDTKTKGSLKTPSARDIDMGSDASRSKAEIMAVVNTHMPDLWNIYNEYLKQKPSFNGKVTLKFTIAPGGDIVSIAIVSSTTGYGEFDTAVKNLVATWKWKAIKSGDTTPTIPFNFAE